MSTATQGKEQHQMSTMTVNFSTTMYGRRMGGTVEAFGWTPDASTIRAIAEMKATDPSKARRMEMRCRKASAEQYNAAWDDTCAYEARVAAQIAEHVANYTQDERETVAAYQAMGF